MIEGHQRSIQSSSWQTIYFHGSISLIIFSSKWRHNERDGVSNHRRILIACSTVFFRRRSKKTRKLRITGLCDGNPTVTVGFPSQRASPFDDAIMDRDNLVTSWNGKVFRIIGTLSMETTGQRWNYLTKNQYCRALMFLCRYRTSYRTNSQVAGSSLAVTVMYGTLK